MQRSESERSPERGTASVGPGRAGFLLVLAALALCLRWGALELAGPVEPIGDEVYYAEVASRIAQGEGHVSRRLNAKAAWPPAQSYWLSWFVQRDDLALRGAARRDALLTAYHRAQLAVSTLLVLAVAGLGAALFDRRVGAAAGLVAAFHPTLVAFGHYLWSESLFALLAVLGWWASWEARRRSSAGLAVAAGLAFGCATLTREVGLVFAAVVSLWWVGVEFHERGHRIELRALAAPALILVVAALVVVPWAWRNHAELGGFVPVSTVGWMGVREGNTLRSPEWMRKDQKALGEFRNDYYSAPGDLARQALARREALELIRAEQPTWIAKKIARNVNLLLVPDDFIFKKLSWGSYGDVRAAPRRAVLVVSIGVWTLLLLAGALGLAADPTRGRAAFALLPVAATVAIHVLANASVRYRIPILPLLMIWATALFLRPQAWLAGLSAPRWIAPALVALFFFFVSVPWFAGDARSLWQSGTYERAQRD